MGHGGRLGQRRASRQRRRAMGSDGAVGRSADRDRAAGDADPAARPAVGRAGGSRAVGDRVVGVRAAGAPVRDRPAAVAPVADGSAGAAVRDGSPTRDDAAGRGPAVRANGLEPRDRRMGAGRPGGARRPRPSRRADRAEESGRLGEPGYPVEDDFPAGPAGGSGPWPTASAVPGRPARARPARRAASRNATRTGRASTGGRAGGAAHPIAPVGTGSHDSPLRAPRRGAARARRGRPVRPVDQAGREPGHARGRAGRRRDVGHAIVPALGAGRGRGEHLHDRGARAGGLVIVGGHGHGQGGRRRGRLRHGELGTRRARGARHARRREVGQGQGDGGRHADARQQRPGRQGRLDGRRPRRPRPSPSPCRARRPR